MANSSGNTIAQDPVERLAAFLRRGQSDIKVLTGKSKLSLTTVYLSILNRCFATTHPNDSSTEVVEGGQKYDAESVKYLRDILHRTVGLKLLHENATLKGAVDVSRFHALTVLEVKRVPVHFLVGLGSLRSQLRVLICSRCVHSLQMLLVGCGGDKAEEQDWPVLHTLNLSHNYIDALDESLRFLPALKALDLSHNNIRHTRDYFESLPEIIHLNLSFNQLTRVPSLGEFIPSHLQTLFLRGNNIESLSGVEYLEEIGTLDLAKNAIFDTSDLFSLGYLHRLRKMHFDGNPFTFQSKWRLMIARYLAPEAAQIVTYIDEIPLNKAEIQIVPTKSMVRPMRPDYLSDNFSASLRSDMSYDLEESMDLEASLKKRKSRVKRFSTKVRNASISEQSEDKKQRARQRLSDAGGTAKSSSSPRSTPGTDAKKEFEDMRQMHGKDWLLALHNPYEPVSKPPVPSNQTAEPHHTTTNAKLGSLKHEDGTRRHVQVDVHVERDGDADGRGPVVVVEEVVERIHMPSEESAGLKSFDGVNGQVKGQFKGQEDNEGVKQLERQASDEQFDLLMRQESQLQIRMNDGDLREEEDHEEEEDDGIDLCGPLLIRLHKTEPPVQLFVTVKEAFIEEKNLYGKVVQRLETKTLKGMNMSIEGMLDEFSNAPVELPVVTLSFDYINKERRKREYVMDDMNTCESLIQVLEPIIVQNEASKTRVFLHCLKCLKEFPKDQAKKRVEKKPKKSSTWTSEEESGSDFDSVSEVLTCPSCGSNLLLEVDDPRKSEVNTPYGSVTSFDLSANPIAASSPWKQKRDTNAVTVNNLQDPSVDIFSSNSSDLSYTKSASSTPSQLSPKKDRTKTNLSPAHGPRGQAIRDLLMPSPSKDGSLTSSLSSQHSGTSADYRLPDSSIKMEASESSAVEELANYPQEKLKELLTTNKSGFRQSTEQPSSAPQRYSLCPTDGGSVSSMDAASGPPTPVQPITSNPFESHFRNSSSTETKADPSRSSPSHLINGNAKTPADECDGGRASGKSNEVESRTNGGSDEVFNHRVDHRYSEDDIVVLDNSEAASNHNMEYRNAFHIQEGYNQEKDTVDANSVGRLDSNESDIAVISETDVQSSNSALTMLRNSSVGNLSTTSDTVFENSHHANISNKSSESPVQPRQDTSSDDHRSLLSSNEHDAIYKSNSGSESTGDVNGSGQWNVHGTNRAAMKRAVVQSSPSHSINSVTVETASMLSMAQEDCCNVHHRLKLFFSMSVFGNDEEFTCLLRGTVFQFSKKLSFDGLVVVSTEGIYIMKITKEESENPSDWLAKKTQHPIKDLLRVHVGLGSQTMQFEFSSDGILYTIVIGDKKRTRQFAAVLMNLISTSAWKKKFKGVVWEHAQTFLNLTDEVFVPQATGDTSYEVDPQINVFITSQLKTRIETKQGTEMSVEDLGIVVTATDIYLVEENHFYPLAPGKNKKSVKGQQQFIPKGHRKISDISGLELYADSLTDATVSFFSEDTGEESQWNISTTSDASLDQLLTMIKQPWKEMFGVNIQETLHPSIAIQDLA